jgi:thimet oligopeptidase
MGILLAILLLSPAALAGVVSPPGRGPAGVSFRATPYEMLGKYVAAQDRMEASLKAILAAPSAGRTFANTVAALEEAMAVFGDDVQPMILLADVSVDAEVREAARMIQEDFERADLAIWSNKELYAAVEAAAQASGQLSSVDGVLLASYRQAFRQAGMGLGPWDRAKLKETQERLSVLASQFMTNLNGATQGLELSLEQLEGLPQDYVNGLAKTEEGKYKVGLSYPEYMPFMSYAKDSELRRQLQLKYNTRAAQENGPLLVEALQLRDQSAKLLGKETYPHLALEERMAGTPEKVWDFLTGLLPALSERARSEGVSLLAEKRKEVPEASVVENWEEAYYTDKLRKALYDYDPEEVRQYFPLEGVIEKTLGLYQELFGLTFTPVEEAEVWHPEVKLFLVRDAKTGEDIGHFYLDLHPREGKYGHAAEQYLVKGRRLPDGSYRLPAAAMIVNFPKAAPGKPALMPFDDVETFFHEFGHVLHEVLTRAPYATLSGTAVALDFVETPSQAMEYFVWDKRVIDRISGHYEDPSRKLPGELFERMKQAKNHGLARINLVYLARAMADLAMHAAAPANTGALYNLILKMITLVTQPAGSRADASFEHMIEGYEAGYYSYIWAEVYAREVFAAFAEAGMLSPEVGERYRRTILEKGASQAEMETLKEFLGREPGTKAFLKSLERPQS